MITVILIGLMYVLSIGGGVASIVLFVNNPLKSFKDFGMTFVYGITCYIALKISTWIICWILNKFFNCDFDSDVRKKFAIIYFIVVFVGITVVGYITSKSIFTTIILVLWMFFINLYPIMFEFNIGTDEDGYGSNVTSNNSSKKYDIKSGYVTDQFGNIKAKSTTYIDGDIKKTYVTDNLGNTIAESTTIGNHTTTKIK